MAPVAEGHREAYIRERFCTGRMDQTREVLLLCMLACLCLWLTWALEENLLAAVFGVEAGWAFVEAISGAIERS